MSLSVITAMMEYNYSQTAEELLLRDRILIVTHKNPDGDTIGSAGALCSALRRAGKTAYLYPNPQFTEKYLPYIKDFPADPSYVPEYIVSTDVSAEDMFADGFEGLPDLCIDHHPTNPHFGKLNCIHPEMAACCQIILEIIEAMGNGVTPAEADLLYIGLSTDCGCFRYSNTDEAAHAAAARLIHYGADIYPLNEKLFRLVSPARLRLEGMIYNGLDLYREGAVVISTVTLDMLRICGAVEDDLDDISSLAGRVSTRKIAITVREKKEGVCKISVRTARGYSASALCREFGGGGHEAAAGCTIQADPEETKRQLLEAIDRLKILY